MSRRFEIGTHIWFVLHYDLDGNFTGLEEHDWREGGYIIKPPELSIEEFFIRNVGQRAHGEEYQKTVEEAARQFLLSTEKSIRV